MGLLLYKSNEMFSATELIRKSKSIFDKILNKEIEKGIILRDGKPAFLLMEFEKYEKIMAEFEELKKENTNLSPKETPPKIKKQKKKKPKKEEIAEEKPEKQILDENQNQTTKEDMIEIEGEQEIQIEEEITEEEVSEEIELSQEEEISKAFLSIENMNFDETMKKEAQEKIRAKIIRAREERAYLLAQEEQQIEEEEQQELQLKEQIENEKKKKERELKEFWD